MTIQSPDSARFKEARIRAVYAKRDSGIVYSWLNSGHLFTVQERERRVLALLKQFRFFPLDGKKILEIGYGSGYWLREFIKWVGPAREYDRNRSAS